MDTELKLCKNCKHFKRCSYDNNYLGECVHPNVNHSIDLITGEKIPRFANNERGLYGQCGKEGKLFEQRQSFWQQLLGN